MSIFSKLAFWKKDDLNFDDTSDPFKQSLGPNDPLGAQMGGQDFTQPQMPQNPMESTSRPSFSSQPSSSGYSTFSQPSQSSSNHELELVSAKLDAIKATMDSINQRLANIERIANQEQDNHQW